MEAQTNTDKPEPSEAKPKRSRLGLIVRLLIYVPLLGIFGWKAGDTFLAQRGAADDSFRGFVHTRLHAMPAPRTIMLPNGQAMPVYELTEQQAIEAGLLPAPADEAAPPQ